VLTEQKWKLLLRSSPKPPTLFGTESGSDPASTQSCGRTAPARNTDDFASDGEDIGADVSV